MAKKKSLKERIDALVNALGAAEKPSSAQIRNELVGLALDVEKLEDGQALAEKDARISDLEAALEKSDVELGNLKVLLEEAGGELEAFRAEQKKQSEAEREIPEVQFEILKRLPLVNEHGSTLDVIARTAAIPKDEAEIHLDALCKAKPALAWRTSSWPEVNETAWRRTMAGNRYVVSKRLAGEEEKEEPRRKYADRTTIEADVLEILADLGEMTCQDFDTDTISADSAEVALADLEKDGLVKVVEPAKGGKEAKYDLSAEGVRYLLERRYLH